MNQSKLDDIVDLKAQHEAEKVTVERHAPRAQGVQLEGDLKTEEAERQAQTSKSSKAEADFLAARAQYAMRTAWRRA